MTDRTTLDIAICFLSTVLALAAPSIADQEVVATAGETRVRAVVDDDTGNVANARVETKVDESPGSWTVTEPETEIVEDTIERTTQDDDPVFDDCNGNGLDDLVEILEGEAEDINGNLVPDRCEFDYGDLNLDGVIDGADLFIVLGWFASPFPLFGDLDSDGSVGSADLGVLLVRWGPTPF